MRFAEEAIQASTSALVVRRLRHARRLAQALHRFGTMPLGELCDSPAARARAGIEVHPMQAFLFEILGPILIHQPEGQAIYAPRGTS